MKLPLERRIDALAAAAVLVVGGVVVMLGCLDAGAMDPRSAAAGLAGVAVLACLLLVGSLGVVRRDLARRRRAETALRESEDRFRLMAENASDVICLHEADGRFAWVSPSCLALLGYEPGELVGRHPLELYHPDDRDRAIAAVQADPAAALARATYRLRAKGGDYRWVETVKRIFADESGAVRGLQSASRDVTERVEFEQRLLEAKEAAEAASRAKGEFLSRMSHELRTPLNSVIGFANVLRRNKGGALSPASLGYVERIRANGEHLLTLINDILDLARVEAGRMTLESASVSAAEVVRAAVALCDGPGRDRSVRLACEVPDDLASVETDPARLRQVLVNLVGNALKFTPSGSVVVRVEADPRTRRPTRIDVADTGIGIAPERLAAIFETFEQGDASTTRRYGGSGLGLAISRSLCQLMGYALVVRSAPGAGSTFSVLLEPAADRAAA